VNGDTMQTHFRRSKVRNLLRALSLTGHRSARRRGLGALADCILCSVNDLGDFSTPWFDDIDEC